MAELDKDIKLKSLWLNLTPEYLAEKYGYPEEAIKKTEPTTPETDGNTEN